MLQQVEEVRQGLPPEVLGDDVREAADGESRVVDGLPAPSGALQFLLEQVRREQNYLASPIPDISPVPPHA